MSADSKRSRLRFWIPVAAVLTIHAALGLSAGRQLTATGDEYWHLPVGLLNLRTGRFHFDNLNPPLCRMAAALPLTITSARTGPPGAALDALAWGDDFLAANPAQYERWFALGRAMIVLISVAGGICAAVWARELFGDGAGCLAALLWAFEPNLLAHGSLVTTDMGAAAFFVFTWFALWRMAQRPSWKGAALFGLLLGLAQLAKFTALLLYPISLAGLLLAVAARERESSHASESVEPDARGPSRAAGDPATQTAASRLRTGFVRLVPFWLVAVLLSLLVLNAGYLFRGSFAPLASYDFRSQSLQKAASRLAALGQVPVPLPRDYIEGIDHQRQIMEQKHPVFLDGTWSKNGFPRYYLWALFYKLPHPLLILPIVTLFWLVMPRGVARRPWTQVYLLLPAVATIVVADSSPMQLGVRYVLPAIPFLILFASQSACWADFKESPARAATVIGLAAWMTLSVRYHPGHLAYFNELAGGPIGGRELLLDSNLDWGQDLGGLKEFLDARGIDDIGLAYFGTVPPAALGIRYHIPPADGPHPGLYAVSVNFEKGRPHWVRTPTGAMRPVNIGEFSYFSFNKFTPIARIGYSIDVFQLDERDVASWNEALRQEFGR